MVIEWQIYVWPDCIFCHSDGCKKVKKVHYWTKEPLSGVDLKYGWHVLYSGWIFCSHDCTCWSAPHYWPSKHTEPTIEGLLFQWNHIFHLHVVWRVASITLQQLFTFLYARLKNGRIMPWQCPSVRLSFRPSVRPSAFSGLFFNMLWLTGAFTSTKFAQFAPLSWDTRIYISCVIWINYQVVRECLTSWT